MFKALSIQSQGNGDSVAIAYLDYNPYFIMTYQVSYDRQTRCLVFGCCNDHVRYDVLATSTVVLWSLT